MAQIYLARVRFNLERGSKCRDHLTEQRVKLFCDRCETRRSKMALKHSDTRKKTTGLDGAHADCHNRCFT